MKTLIAIVEKSYKALSDAFSYTIDDTIWQVILQRR